MSLQLGTWDTTNSTDQRDYFPLPAWARSASIRFVGIPLIRVR